MVYLYTINYFGELPFGMVHHKTLLVLFLLIAGGNDWVLKKDKDHITVYTRKKADSDYKELKCVSTVKTSLSAIVKMLTDVDDYTDWIFHCESSKVVKKVNDAELYYYQLTSAPFPVSDRDMVAHLIITQDSKSKKVTVTADAAEGLVPEKDDIVRIKKFHSSYTLIPKEKGMVEIDYEMGADPGGNIPAWLVNMAIVKGPFTTQQMMNKILAGAKYKSVKLPFITEP